MHGCCVPALPKCTPVAPHRSHAVPHPPPAPPHTESVPARPQNLESFLLDCSWPKPNRRLISELAQSRATPPPPYSNTTRPLHRTLIPCSSAPGRARVQVHVQKVYGTLAATTAVASVGSVLGMGLMVRSTALTKRSHKCACLCAYWLVRARAPACVHAFSCVRASVRVHSSVALLLKAWLSYSACSCTCLSTCAPMPCPLTSCAGARALA